MNREGSPEQSLICVVEDEAEIASLISFTLVRAGFATRIFHDAATVEQALGTQLPALILADRMLPDVDGLEILRSMQRNEQLRSVKSIIVSALGSEADKVHALNLGADDYIAKPFSLRELVARVRAVLRSPHRAVANLVLQLGGLLADLDARTMTADGRELQLTKTEFDLLVYFMRRPAEILSRNQLLEDLWPVEQQSIGLRIVDVYVRRLRQKIEQDAQNPMRLVTRRGNGYALVVPS